MHRFQDPSHATGSVCVWSTPARETIERLGNCQPCIRTPLLGFCLPLHTLGSALDMHSQQVRVTEGSLRVCVTVWTAFSAASQLAPLSARLDASFRRLSRQLCILQVHLCAQRRAAGPGQGILPSLFHSCSTTCHLFRADTELCACPTSALELSFRMRVCCTALHDLTWCMH